MKSVKGSFIAALVCTTGIFPQHAQAGLITLDAIDSGYYEEYRFEGVGPNTTTYSRKTGAGYETSNSYFGGPAASASRRHGYFVFDLTSISGAIQSAELYLTRGAVQGGSDIAVSFNDFVSPISDLSGGNGTHLSTIFSDLADGSAYGALTLQESYDTPLGPVSYAPSYVHALSLNSIAALDLNNAAGGLFAIGASLTSFNQTSPNALDYDVLAFGNTDGASIRQLHLTIDDTIDPNNPGPGGGSTPVAEPASILLFGVGLVGMVGVRRRIGK